jgi:hypothetical protein
MIADWSELMVEVSQRIKDGSVMQRAAMITGLAEEELNKALRTAEMEAQDTIDLDATCAGPLPSDYLDVRAVTQGSTRLLRYPLAQLRAKTQCGYAIVGDSIITNGVTGEITLDYYARIPPLKENGTNWLLESEPEIYLYAVMKQAMLSNMNIEGGSAAGGYLADLLERKRLDDAHRRFGDTTFQFSGVAP